MSVDLLVFLEHSASITASQWQRYCDSLRIPLRIPQNNHPDTWPTTDGGGVPVELSGKPAVFQLFYGSFESIAGPEISAKPEFRKYKFGFQVSFGGGMRDAAAASYAAACLALALNGSAFDPQGNEFISANELLKEAQTLATAEGADSICDRQKE